MKIFKRATQVKFKRNYSLKSHYNSAAIAQFNLHESFVESLFEIEAISEFYMSHSSKLPGQVNLDVQKLLKAYSLFAASLLSHSHIENLGFLPCLHEEMDKDTKHKFQTFHVKESQQLHHLEHSIKNIFHHDSELKRKECFKKLPEDVLKMGQIIDEHFDEKDRILLQKAQKVMDRKDLLSIREKLMGSFNELTPLQCENSFKLGHNVLIEVSKLPNESDVKLLLREFRKRVIGEDWEELLKRNPELGSFEL